MFSSQNSQVSSAANYIEDVFSTYLYTGNDSTQTITNGIDLSTKGGMVWIKARNTGSTFNCLFDTARGATKALFSNATNAQGTYADTLTSFNTTGFTLGADTTTNFVNAPTGQTEVSWTFRKQPKFFEVVTYTGNGASSRTIAHSLGSVPGCIIVKGTSVSGCNWAVYHRSTGADKFLLLNTTDASASDFNTYWGGANPTSTNFSIGSATDVNQNGTTYVAYLFAHDAGGFGLTGTDNVISCGSFTTDGSGNATVNLGYEPQWLLVKKTGFGGWWITDTMRGMTVATSSNVKALFAEDSAAESTGYEAKPNATGFTVGPSSDLGNSVTCVYIAIRRGPMRVPTSGTSVFSSQTGTYSAGDSLSVGFPADMYIDAWRTGTAYKANYSRLVNFANSNSSASQNYLKTNTTDAEVTTSQAPSLYDLWNTTAKVGSWNQGVSEVWWMFRRAPSFFDEVCYTTPGSTFQDVPHNLGVTPELIIVKRRNGVDNWGVQYVPFGSNSALYLNTTDAVGAGGWSYFFTSVTASSITVATSVSGYTAGTYVAYLFATCAGVSKVGSYTGDGTVGRVIDCGFTGGARFIMLKKTSTTSDWYVYDTARGIVSGGEKSLSLNTTAAESGSSDVIDPDSSGFAVGTGASDFFNESGVTYIYLAIA